MARYGTPMRVATWNVNSVKQRLPRLLPWLDERQPDVVCLQETKLADDAFDQLLGEELTGRGYEIARHGEAQWNGVAILSRVGLDDAVSGIPGGPGFPHQEARAVSATCGGIRMHCVYVPNGRTPDSEHYHYKLAWLDALGGVVGSGPEDAIVCGDMNIAPADIDVFDPKAYIGQTHVTPPERAALERSASPWSARRRARSLARRACVHLLGLPSRHVPSRPWDADRPGACQCTGRRARQGGLGRPAGAQGHQAQRSCSRDRRSGRGARRGHRTARPSAIRPGRQARPSQAAAVVVTSK